MAGGESDDDKRQPLWLHGGYDTSGDLYTFMSHLVAGRKKMLELGQADEFKVLVADDGNRVFGFRRGLSVVLTSTGGQDSGEQSSVVQASELPPGLGSDGTQLCDVLSQGNCFAVANGQLEVTLSGGLPVILFKKLSD
eukprot:TRINITY_DN476_c0_g1_i1.p1 TRINITY_DN476_c0_g1~~TRINITY_DN476_c0_g1_i1.p1  ORF type:complete len:138 (-),score=31.57 TRINITY_DN476_c0_g1_i1:368-781(-)